MEIIEALRQEESKLHGQLAAIQNAIAALNGESASIANGGGKRTMSAESRAKIARAAKARWAKIRAEKSKKGEITDISVTESSHAKEKIGEKEVT